jgi:hypothetical protein
VPFLFLRGVLLDVGSRCGLRWAFTTEFTEEHSGKGEFGFRNRRAARVAQPFPAVLFHRQQPNRKAGLESGAAMTVPLGAVPVRRLGAGGRERWLG